jgi:tyrosine-protein kinase
VSSERARDLLLKQWLLIVVCVLAGALGAAVAGRAITRATPRYEATATVQAIIYGSVTDIPGFVATQAFFANSDRVVSRIAAHYPQLTEAQIQGEISASPVSGTRLLEIRVTDSDPTRAASIANDVAGALVAVQQEDAQQAADTNALALMQKDLADTKATIDAVTAQLSKAQTSGASDSAIQALSNQLDSLRALRSSQELTLQSAELAARSGTMLLAVADQARVGSAAASGITSSPVLHAAIGALLGLALALVIIAFRELFLAGGARRRPGARLATERAEAPLLDGKRVVSTSTSETRS